MVVQAEVLRETSFDPKFKVVFSVETDKVIIKRGYAEIIRKAPKPVITYDEGTSEKINLIDRNKLELELLNTVIHFLLSHGVSRSFKGNVVLNMM